MFLHAAEGAHGDLGVVTPGDVVLAVSSSGETDDILRLLPTLRQLGAELIALTRVRDSRLAAASAVVLLTGRAREACPLGLAPTTSSTAALALGDALAMALLERRGFREEWLNVIHPDDIPRVTQAWSAASTAKSMYRVEYRLRRHDGQYRHVLVRGVPIVDSDGSVREYIGACIDLTDFYNAGLNEAWHARPNSGYKHNDLSWLPRGMQTFAGVEFDVRGVIQLAGRSLVSSRFPTEVNNIKLNRKCRALHFLHSTGWAVPDRTRIGHFRVIYSDGESRLRLGLRHRIPVIHVVRRQAQADLMRDLGGEHILNSSEPGFAQQLRSLAQKLQATLLLDAVGGAMTQVLADDAPYGSTILLYSPLSSQKSLIDPLSAAVRDLHFDGWFLPNWLRSKNFIQSYLFSQQAQSLIATDLQSPVHKRLPLSAAQQGVEVYIRSMTAGKILLVADPQEVTLDA